MTRKCPLQVGLLEALQSFGVYPDLVIGHSAGEVAAAYAAGLLSLEDAVRVVYHRSVEQQKLAGSGRMLAVSLGEEVVRQLLAEHSLEGDVEVACVNSPSSVVLAGRAEDLDLVTSRLPEGTAATLIPGNIAFHSSRVDGILPSMQQRLSFLDQRQPAWSLPFVSSVTARVETRVDARYFCDNVRKPVLFKQAVEAAFAGEHPPDVVVEIGPHRTLISPLLQVRATARPHTTTAVVERRGRAGLVLLQIAQLPLW